MSPEFTPMEDDRMVLKEMEREKKRSRSGMNLERTRFCNGCKKVVTVKVPQPTPKGTVIKCPTCQFMLGDAYYWD